MLPVLRDWLSHGDVSEGAWADLIVRRANQGALARAGALLFDLPALAQPFSCRSAECTPGMRAPRTRSCCADIEVPLAPWERRAVAKALPALADYLAPRDPRWARGAPEVFSGEQLARPDGRCVFAVLEKRGLRCGLQRFERREGLALGTLKPVPCRLFPLVLVDLGEGRRLFTALHRGTSALVDTVPPRRFPCLREDPERPPLYRALRRETEGFLGRRTYRAIARAVSRWRRARAGGRPGP